MALRGREWFIVRCGGSLCEGMVLLSNEWLIVKYGGSLLWYVGGA